MKKQLKISSRILIAIFGLLFSLNLVQAQRNDFFYAKYDGQGKVYFQWFFDNSNNVIETFVIFKAEGAYKEFNEEAFTEFKKLSVQDVKQEKNGLFNFVAEDKLEGDEYSYALFIYLKDGSVVKSQPFIVFNNFEPPKKGIYFVSEPVRFAFLNKEYKYEVKAVTFPDEKLELVYKLMKGPEGMKIDNTTGVITWTPTKKLNNTAVSIAAYVKNDAKMIAYQNFDIYIYNCEKPIILSGRITDKYDKPVQYGYVNLFPAKAPNSNKPTDPRQYGSEIIDGEYKIEADAEEYIMVFSDIMGRAFYFKNAQQFEKADKIVLKCGENQELNWKIEALSNNYFTVSGKVTDEQGEPVAYLPVIFESIPNGEVNIPENHFVFNAMTDENGHYKASLPEDYKFVAYVHLDKAMGMKNMPMILYYNQTYNRKEATIIKTDKDYSGIDFKFMKNPDFKFFVVKGKVTDKDNQPIPGAMVNFEGFNDKTNIGGYYHYYDAVYTDKNGNYKIELPDMFKFIAFAINMNGIDVNRDYRALFYKQTYIREKATIITLDKDLTGIDFKFDVANVPPSYQSAIVGKVINFEGNPIQYAFVEAIRLDNDNIDYSEKSHFAYTDANGFYAFKGLKEGRYVVFASTQKTSEFSCGYYLANNLATISFEEATRIELNGKNVVENIVVQLPKFEIKQGGGIIKGEIYNQRNFDEANKSANAISSAKLYLKENQNALINFNESNANGSFVITGVPSGNYTFTIEKAGFHKFEKLINVDETNVTDLGLIMLMPTMGTSVDEPNHINSLVFPNPATSEIVFEFTSINNINEIMIINQDGKLIKNELVNLPAGLNSLKINVSSLAIGKYFILIADGNNNYAIPFIISK